MYRTVEAVWKDNHLEPLEEIKTGENVRYLITVIEDKREMPPPIEREDFGFEKAQEILKHFTGSLSDAVIEERDKER